MYYDPSIENDCCAAMRGQTIPPDITDEVVQASLIRGIRLHYEFAISNEVTDLASHNARIARARNARMIMSNHIPGDMAQNEMPYCIWHPDFATEATYRELARRYPRMRYTVGRASAAAGYIKLYEELNLLPDVSIAEEARESGTDAGRHIYESIMRQPCRYAVMDDYTLTIETENPQCPAFLNGDTEVRFRLKPRWGSPWLNPNREVPCIEEDMHANIDKVYDADIMHLSAAEARLLYTPLPQDLPTVKKRLLIQMAAFEGNVDRYSRLTTRARAIERSELVCIVRGIYHHTMFARWWAEEIAHNTPRVQAISEDGRRKIRMAVSARRIMLNDPREFYYNGWPPGAPQPYLIWWPLRPMAMMLTMLVDKVPEMREQAAVAAIFCDYESEYKALRPTPNDHIWFAATQSHNPFYREDVERRAKEQGIEDVERINSQDIDLYCMELDMEPTTVFDFSESGRVYDGMVDEEGPYNGRGPDSNETQFQVWDSLVRMQPYLFLQQTESLELT
ncbi:hypothetical protein F4777DRAFT_599215 [Nemania sp. FL0916]|nr:hypothetical protein F4777DRAFT_599215 [Nemania sp. FL0916]